VPRRSEDRKSRAIYYWAIAYQGKKERKKERRKMDVSVK